jgi:hypothetical protein
MHRTTAAFADFGVGLSTRVAAVERFEVVAFLFGDGVG